MRRLHGNSRVPGEPPAGAVAVGFAPPEEGPSLLLTIDEVAMLVRMSTRNIQRWKSAGWFPKEVNIGGSVRWRRADIVAWVAAGCPKLENGLWPSP